MSLEGQAGCPETSGLPRKYKFYNERGCIKEALRVVEFAIQ